MPPVVAQKAPRLVRAHRVGVRPSPALRFEPDTRPVAEVAALLVAAVRCWLHLEHLLAAQRAHPPAVEEERDQSEPAANERNDQSPLEVRRATPGWRRGGRRCPRRRRWRRWRRRRLRARCGHRRVGTVGEDGAHSGIWNPAQLEGARCEHGSAELEVESRTERRAGRKALRPQLHAHKELFVALRWGVFRALQMAARRAERRDCDDDPIGGRCGETQALDEDGSNVRGGEGGRRLDGCELEDGDVERLCGVRGQERGQWRRGWRGWATPLPVGTVREASRQRR